MFVDLIVKPCLQKGKWEGWENKVGKKTKSKKREWKQEGKEKDKKEIENNRLTSGSDEESQG